MKTHIILGMRGPCMLKTIPHTTYHSRTRLKFQRRARVWNLRMTVCNSVETVQPGDRTTDPGIVMPERYESSQRGDSLASVVITPVRHTHTRLHTPLSNICSSPSSLQHTRGLTSPDCLLPHFFPIPKCSVLSSGILVLHYR